MKKWMAAAAGGCLVATGMAHAQSSVTLYGLIDEGLNYTNNVGGKRLIAMSSGDTQGSRWGLRGSEDLGGGAAAIFRLESGFNLNNGKLGQQGRAFGRQAYVGLSSASYGTVTLGRQYDSVTDYLAGLTANGNWGGGVFTHPYDNDNTDDTFRLNNAIKYASRDYHGFSFGGMLAMSNGTSFGRNRAWSAGAQYQNGPLALGAAYLQINDPNADAGGAVSIGPNGSPDGSWTARRQRIWGAGVNYTIGATTLGLSFIRTDLANPTDTQYANFAASPTLGAASSIRFDNVEVNAKYQFAPAFYVGGMYTYTRARFNGTSGRGASPKYHQFGLMADYNLSKRTDVYVQAAYVLVANAASVAGTGLEFAANPDTAGPASTNRQVMARIAMRHKF
ncbi:porin [Burkholderia sp. Ac-20379]|uniref:porin n=1 Tax=Burkholderia sp. Ac-20379 TaxID=2703900 RepID=UPI001981434D|nr:porin [Burkholderia sp. Ac-20379]MBN3723292.1 porin [Burkholderia sp. Ac-20379]